MEYEFAEAPDYGKLSFILERALIEQGLVPVKNYKFWSMELNSSNQDR